MTAVVDSGVLVAAADRRDRLHEAAAQVLRALRGELVVPEPVTAEADYLIGRRAGRDDRLHRYGTRQLVTFDERCFRAVAPLQGSSFTLLPADG